MESPFRHQRTICRPVTVSGFGYWSSLDVDVEFCPAPPDTGIVFVRRDTPEATRIPARIAFRTDAQRRTTLIRDGASVDLVEHILAALAGLKIDNCEIGVNRAEMPGCDGSSLPFVEALLSVGVETQSPRRSKLVVEHPIRVASGDSWIQAVPNLQNEFRVRFQLDYLLHPVIGAQHCEFVVDEQVFCDELAPARTFVLKHEVEYLRQMGLGRRASYRDLLVFDEYGPLDNKVRFDNECARHKALDVIGDFALAPFDIVGTFTANQSGHRLNAEMVEALLFEASIYRPNGDVIGPDQPVSNSRQPNLINEIRKSA